MANPSEQSVLRRMVAPPRPPRPQSGGGVDRAVRVEFPRTADRLLGLTVEIQSIEQLALQKGEVLALLTPSDLVYVLKAACGAGIVLVDKGLLSALVEVQTTGRVTEVPPLVRAPTQTDAIVASDIVDGWIADLQGGAEAHQPFIGANREDRIIDPRAAGLLLDPVGYHSLRIVMSISGGAKTGVLQVIAPTLESASRSDGSDGDLAGALRSHLGEVRTSMRAVLGQVSVPLSDMLDLSRDRVFPVAAEDIRRVTLVRDGGVPVGEAHLGQINGKWAVRPFGPREASGPAALYPPKFAGGSGQGQLTETVTRPDAAPAREALAEDGFDDEESPEVQGLPDLPDLPEFPGGADA